MKATIYDLVAGARLRDVVPPAYRDAVAKDARPDGVYSVLLFDHAERDVVPSPPVRKALRRLKEAAADGIVAVGTVFTDEALALLAEAGARVVTFRTARWTDESARARQP
jgi:DNA-binding LacI/PurR family transcriptional regulator